MAQPRPLTVLDMTQVVHELARSNAEMLATTAHLVNSDSGLPCSDLVGGKIAPSGKESNMPTDNPVGLAELIEQVKRELLSTEINSEADIPLFSVDDLTLELNVTVRKEGKGGLKIYVAELGGGVSREDVQKVKVTLSPLLSRQERIDLYKRLYPHRWTKIEHAITKATIKGDEEGSVFKSS
jgi:hypothetical protein